jgi:hypothetical protein
MGRAHDRGKRPAGDAPIEGNLSAMHRAVTGLSTTRGTPQSCQRDSKGEPRKLGTHAPLKEQAEQINQSLRGHYAYYGIAGHVGRLLGVYRPVERSWRAMLRRRRHKGHVRWEAFVAIKRRYPLQRPKRSRPYTRLKQYAVL